jgi:hypothetical protein
MRRPAAVFRSFARIHTRAFEERRFAALLVQIPKPIKAVPGNPMIRQAWLTLPSCFASSGTPTLLRMIFSSLVIVSSPRCDTPMSTLGDDTSTIASCQI